jgi:ABC-type phosphate transport system substrate-binding protein
MRFLIILLTLAIVTPAFGQVSIIANKNIDASSITFSVLRNIYQLDTKELGGTSLTLFDLNIEGPAKKTFCDAVGLSTMELRKVWLRKQLTGNGKPPQAITTEAEMIARVASTPGAIGFVSSASVTSDVKVLLQIR